MYVSISYVFAMLVSFKVEKRAIKSCPGPLNKKKTNTELLFAEMSLDESLIMSEWVSRGTW